VATAGDRAHEQPGPPLPPKNVRPICRRLIDGDDAATRDALPYDGMLMPALFRRLAICPQNLVTTESEAAKVAVDWAFGNTHSHHVPRRALTNHLWHLGVLAEQRMRIISNMVDQLVHQRPSYSQASLWLFCQSALRHTNLLSPKFCSQCLHSAGATPMLLRTLLRFTTLDSIQTAQAQTCSECDFFQAERADAIV